MNGLGNLGINLSAYNNVVNDNQVLFGNASTSMEQLNDLSKALEAGEITGRETTNSTTASGAGLKMESLDKTLKLLTYRESEIVLWKKIPKLAAYNTVEEYNQLASYGQDRGGFMQEGGLPLEEDSTYIRRAQLVKFLGVTKSVTHPMTLVQTMIGDVIAREAKNGSLWILRKLDKALTKANSRLVAEEFNGLYAQHEENDAYSSKNAYYNGNEVVVDLRGDYLQEKYIERGAEGIIENFGLANELFAPPKVLSDFVQSFYGNKFIQPNSEMTSAGGMGQKVNYFDSQFGRINLNWDIFMNKGANKTTATPAESPNAPAVIVPDGSTPIAAVAATAANTMWASTDAGAYFYAVSAFNMYGESALTALSASATTIATGGAVDLKWAAGAGANAATGFRVYRSQKGAVSVATSTFYPLFDVTQTEITAGYDGGAAGLVRDLNRIMPNCNQAFMLQMDEDVLAFRQLAPLMKMDLAMISTAYRFMILLYGTPLLFAPKKMVRYINIGLKP
jgi:hypothetical protein